MTEPTPRRTLLMPGSSPELALYVEGDVAFKLETASFNRWQEVQRVRDEIVRAVNALPELVALAEAVVEAAKPGPFEWGGSDTEFAVLDEEEIERARRALALARGEEETNG